MVAMRPPAAHGGVELLRVQRGARQGTVSAQPVEQEREIAAPTVDRGALAGELKAFTEKLPRVDHRIGARNRRKGLA